MRTERGKWNQKRGEEEQKSDNGIRKGVNTNRKE